MAARRTRAKVTTGAGIEDIRSAGTPESAKDNHGLAAFRQKLARGGKVIEGKIPRKRLDRGGYASGGKVKGNGKMTVNVIVAGGPSGGPQAALPMPPPMMPPAMPPRPPIVPPVAPGAPPPGLPPVMPRARGGAALGGPMVAKSGAMPMAPQARPQMPLAPQARLEMPLPGAGVAYPGAMMARAKGGRTAYPLKDGSGGGEGRLEKIRAYGRKSLEGAKANT